MPSNSTTYIAISGAIVIACFGGVIAVFVRLRSMGRLDTRGYGYVAIMVLAWISLAVSAIANAAARGSLWCTVFSLAMLVLIPSVVVFTRLRK